MVAVGCYGRIVPDLDPHYVTGQTSLVARQRNETREKGSLPFQREEVLRSVCVQPPSGFYYVKRRSLLGTKAVDLGSK